MNPSITTIELSAVIPPESHGLRLDQALAELFPTYSRSRLQSWIRDHHITVDGHPAIPRQKVQGGEVIILKTELENKELWQAEAIALNIIYEDDALLVINKPVGLVVHPASGHWQGTLVNALLHHLPTLAALPRAGIVHRLDKDTSGLLVIGKTLGAYTHLVKQLQARTITREYEAITQNVMIAGGTVDLPIGRHPIHRKRMAVIESGKPAVTHYRVLERFQAYTRIKVQLETGRTHQIRVHMAAIHYPLLGDATYGGRMKIPKGASDTLIEALRHYKHQALHASRLVLTHPKTGEQMEWSAPLPDDLQQLLNILRKER